MRKVKEERKRTPDEDEHTSVEHELGLGPLLVERHLRERLDEAGLSREDVGAEGGAEGMGDYGDLRIFGKHRVASAEQAIDSVRVVDHGLEHLVAVERRNVERHVKDEASDDLLK